jgi:hypothetical protein
MKIVDAPGTIMVRPAVLETILLLKVRSRRCNRNENALLGNILSIHLLKVLKSLL